MVKYYLYLNKLTPDPLDYAARVVDVKPYYLDDVIKIMIREGKTLTEEEARSAYLALEKALREITEAGGSIQLSILSTGYSIGGVFYADDETLTPGKHVLNVNAYPGEVIVEAAKKIKLKRVDDREYSPEPRKLTDVSSNTFNEALTPGNMACLKGKNLSFNTEDAEEGIFLVNDRGIATRVEQIARNKPSEVVFLVPQRLAKGSYALEVRNRSYKEIVPGRLKHPLTVQ